MSDALCNGPFGNEEDCPVHGEEIRKARGRNMTDTATQGLREKIEALPSFNVEGFFSELVRRDDVLALLSEAPQLRETNKLILDTALRTQWNGICDALGLGVNSTLGELQNEIAAIRGTKEEQL